MAPPGGRGVEVKGERELRHSYDRAMRNLNKLDTDRPAGIAQTAVQRYAPARTGALRASVRVQRRPGGGSAVQVGVRYGWFVEAGTRYMRGQRFAQRALDASSDKIVAEIGRDAQQELNNVRGA